MARPTTKNDLLESVTQSYLNFQPCLSALTEDERMTAFDFSQDSKKKEAHWARDKNVRDILTHLHEWHCLVINWVEGNLECNDKKNSQNHITGARMANTIKKSLSAIKRFLLVKFMKSLPNCMRVFYLLSGAFQMTSYFQNGLTPGLMEVA